MAAVKAGSEVDRSVYSTAGSKVASLENPRAGKWAVSMAAGWAA